MCDFTIKLDSPLNEDTFYPRYIYQIMLLSSIISKGHTGNATGLILCRSRNAQASASQATERRYKIGGCCAYSALSYATKYARMPCFLPARGCSYSHGIRPTKHGEAMLETGFGDSKGHQRRMSKTSSDGLRAPHTHIVNIPIVAQPLLPPCLILLPSSFFLLPTSSLSVFSPACSRSIWAALLHAHTLAHSA